MAQSVRRPSRRLSFNDALNIWPRIMAGEFLNRIANDYDVNPGRISEIKTEKTHPGSRDMALMKLASGE